MLHTGRSSTFSSVSIQKWQILAPIIVPSSYLCPAKLIATLYASATSLASTPGKILIASMTEFRKHRRVSLSNTSRIPSVAIEIIPDEGYDTHHEIKDKSRSAGKSSGDPEV